MKRILVLLLLLTQVGCFNNDKETVRVSLSTNVSILDPQISKDSQSKEIIMHLFEGLTTENDKGQIIPGVAKTWKVTGKTWIFTLNPDAKWENGKRVKAEDFVTAWERVLSPFLENSEVSKFYIIKNAKEYKQSKVGFDEVGIKALDDKTLVVELNEEISYFDRIVSDLIFSPLNKDFYQSHASSYGMSKKDVLSNGPYKIEDWNNTKGLVLKASKKYRDRDNIKLGKIQFVINGDSQELKKLYEKNELQIVNWTTNKSNVIGENTQKYQTGELYFVQLNTDKNIFSNNKIRKAIALSIDRRGLTGEINQGIESIAESLIPKTIFASKSLFRDEFKQSNYGISYNPQEAKKLFLEGLNELNISFSQVNNINLLVNNEDKEILIGNFLKNQMKKTLNLDVSVQAETGQMREKILNEKDYYMTLGSYKAETSNGLEYLSILKNPKYLQMINWVNLDYDKLIQKSISETNYSNQVQLLFKTETLLMNELPIIPMFFTEKSVLIKDNIKGVRVSNLTGELDLRFTSIKK